MNDKKETIVFVREFPSYRIYKIAKSLKDTDKYRLILVVSYYDKDLMNGIFDKVYSYDLFSGIFEKINKRTNRFYNEKCWPILRLNLKRILKKLGKESPLIYHTISPPTRVSRFVMECVDTPVIYDQYDLLAQSYGFENVDKKELENERFCLENADGIVHKGPESEIQFYRDHGYNISCPELTYFDYCDPNYYQHFCVENSSKKDGDLHIVYVGGIHPKGRPFYMLEIAKILAEQEIHFHIYPSMSNDIYMNLSEYVKYDNKEKFFHFHRSIPYSELIRDIRKYDFGLYFFNFDMKLFSEQIMKLKTAFGNKIPTYIEAGLPIIIWKELKFARKIIEDYEIGISLGKVDLYKLRKIIENHEIQIFRNNILSVRKELDMSNHINKLETFYKLINKSQ